MATHTIKPVYMVGGTWRPAPPPPPNETTMHGQPPTMTALHRAMIADMRAGETVTITTAEPAEARWYWFVALAVVVALAVGSAWI